MEALSACSSATRSADVSGVLGGQMSVGSSCARLVRPQAGVLLTACVLTFVLSGCAKPVDTSVIETPITVGELLETTVENGPVVVRVKGTVVGDSYTTADELVFRIADSGSVDATRSVEVRFELQPPPWGFDPEDGRSWAIIIGEWDGKSVTTDDIVTPPGPYVPEDQRVPN